MSMGVLVWVWVSMRITPVSVVNVLANGLRNLALATTFAHLDATTVLLCLIVELGIYPAVDPLDSNYDCLI